VPFTTSAQLTLGHRWLREACTPAQIPKGELHGAPSPAFLTFAARRVPAMSKKDAPSFRRESVAEHPSAP
jgi:hypothetical protein